MVGAIADWFAVTALFRHPLGLPIPHTALVPRKKDEFGKSLEEFFAENFLNEDVVRERLMVADISQRVGQWLTDPVNAGRVVSEATNVAAIGLRKMRDRDVASLVEEVIIPRFMAEPISPVAGGLLQEIVADNAHHGLVDLALEEAHRWLVHNQETFSDVIGERARGGAGPTQRGRHRSAPPRGHPLGGRHPPRPAAPRPGGPRQPAPSARPGPAARPGHPVPAPRSSSCGCSSSHRWSPPASRCGVRSARRCWRRSRTRTARCAGRATRELAAFGERVGRDEALRTELDTWAGDLVVWAVGRYGNELTAVITQTIERWDGKEAARKIELHVGRDLPVHPHQRHRGRRTGRRRHPRDLVGALMASHVEDVPIRDESIRLGQFLKLANLIESGSDAKELMIQGSVTVNGEVETRRGDSSGPATSSYWVASPPRGLRLGTSRAIRTADQDRTIRTGDQERVSAPRSGRPRRSASRPGRSRRRRRGHRRRGAAGWSAGDARRPSYPARPGPSRR